ncbi:DUF6766 family protein [Pedobacter sp. PACM 27299]|uniref:DUF6766 family protein n=1 Tax=Pedobacter sp. PACM 27299 TaxID=1727164 RepID=UPI000A75D2BE
MNRTPKKHSYFHRNGLSIVFLSLFIVTLAAQALTGWKQHNQELPLHLFRSPILF